VLRFLALPLRGAWAWWLGRPILAAGWVPRRVFAVGLALFTLALSGITLFDLLGLGAGSVHPGWFLGLEWWQRPLYPWIELLPRWSLGYRPGYLWIACLWNAFEGFGLSLLIWRWAPQPPPDSPESSARNSVSASPNPE